MIRDPIVDEVRAIREELSARFEFDIRKIVEDAQQRQAISQSRVVSFEKANQSPQPTGPAAAVSDTSPLTQAGPVAER
jgi:hypothetical protein